MHPFVIVLSGKKILRFGLLTLTILTLLVVIYVERKYTHEVFSWQDSDTGAVRDVKTKRKELALTFDISWGEKRTGPILDILEKKGVKEATFFLSSPWADAHPETVQRIAQRYEIGSHGHKHVNYSELPPEQIREQITTADQIHTRLTNRKPRLIRYPNGDGSNSKKVLNIAKELGYTSIHWGTDSMDWQNPGVEVIVKRVLQKAHPGDIILMHASDSCQQTHEALPIIIDKLREQGYTFTTVSGLLTGAQVKLEKMD